MVKKFEIFSNFFWSPVSRIVPQNLKGDLKKALFNCISSASRSSVAVSVIASQLNKLIKSVTSLVFRREKRYCYSLCIHGKRRLKIEREKRSGNTKFNKS